MAKLFIFLFFIWASALSAQGLPELSFGPVSLGENRLPLSSQDFRIQIEKKEELDLNVFLNSDSLQWVRIDEVILSPRMKLEIHVSSLDDELYVSYHGRPLMLQRDQEKSFLHLFVSLFHPHPIKIFRQNTLVAKIHVLANPTDQAPLIDYSCAPYNVQIDGLQGHFASVGCHLTQSGPIGAEVGLLEIRWLSPSIRFLNGEAPPFVTNLFNREQASAKVLFPDGSSSVVKVSANVPERIYRMRTAIGFGPYLMSSETPSKVRKDVPTSPLMIYGRFTLTEATSLRAFNAFNYNGDSFNKFGVYFAYDVGRALDGRLTITPLLGLQVITFRDFTDGIYPQGFEILYDHAFGLKNYRLIYGMFLPPISSSTSYKNTWVRFGKRIFWELNYLSWQKGPRNAKTWGLSVGIPFMNFF